MERWRQVVALAVVLAAMLGFPVAFVGSFVSALIWVRHGLEIIILVGIALIGWRDGDTKDHSMVAAGVLLGVAAVLLEEWSFWWSSGLLAAAGALLILGAMRASARRRDAATGDSGDAGEAACMGTGEPGTWS